jgi:hypothetical protein
MARALQDMHVLVLAGRAFEEVIAHPPRKPFAAYGDLQGCVFLQFWVLPPPQVIP